MLIAKGLHCKALVNTPFGRKLSRVDSNNLVKTRIEDNRQCFTQARRRLARLERYLCPIVRLDDLHKVVAARKQAQV